MTALPVSSHVGFLYLEFPLSFCLLNKLFFTFPGPAQTLQPRGALLPEQVNGIVTSPGSHGTQHRCVMTLSPCVSVLCMYTSSAP